MKFKKLEEPVFTSDLYYDLFDGGYIKPDDLLKDKEDIKKVNDAVEIIKKFLEAAEENGSIEIG